MADSMAYRGPDDSGSYSSGPLAFGHRRLSILDLSPAGHQPMASADGSHILVFNGEIYNYLELRAELEQVGVQFRTETDSEVLLEAIVHWGPAAVERLNGMWAFAVYDSRERTVFLSRDRIGIKPLHYVDRGDAFAFASEIKALLVALPEQRKPDLPVMRRFLPGGALCDGSETFFAGVSTLLPGHNALYRVDQGSLNTWRYWDLDPSRVTEAAEDHVAHLRELLHSSVRLQLRSDVPVGTCLSGGLDSSTIVSLMAGEHPDPVHTFSGLYPDRAYDESAFVDAVNQHAGTQPHPVWPAPAGDLVADLAKITWHQDQPSAGPGLYTQFHVMRRVAHHVKVVLDGQGGDELFAGYLPYLVPHIRDLIASGPMGYLRSANLALRSMRHWGIPSVGKAAFRVLENRLWRRGKQAGPATDPLLHRSLLERVRGREIRRVEPPRFASHLTDALYWDLRARCLPALLHYEDRNSMAHSVEARVPLLDHRVVELAFSLPDDMKIHGDWTKWALRRAAEDILPHKVAWRRSKLGYPTPFARWIREPSERDAMRELLLSKRLSERGLVDGATVERMWNEHQQGRRDHSWPLWRVATTELWHLQFIDSWQPQLAQP